jgi:hypothetical protein
MLSHSPFHPLANEMRWMERKTNRFASLGGMKGEPHPENTFSLFFIPPLRVVFSFFMEKYENSSPFLLARHFLG